ncbi:hypothetical protein Q4508_13925 [Amphritea sp. 2_MG-2023]|uniref:hypothetical protein n=1 Tax=Amphritea TaxID=515417 RepID=UPI001C0770CE|nr:MULTISPECIES: hypothetical protein [Amphritea]MBU2964977.1 hypothetical protein [Amphritea atlantica]MDO6419652.1 hypothetical protein [Amphritea sp. 2_MG-2023]
MSPELNKRIAKNTLMLYFRQLLILFVSLYTIRVILDELGVDDYGVYGAVAGLVALSAFLPGSLAQATQRFFSFALGEQNQDRLNKTFSVNLALYSAVALIAFAILQTVGLWFVNTQLAVPDGRFEAAKTLYHYATLTFLVSVFTTPFMAIIMAHEDMKLYAYISILEAFMKLGVVFLLQYITWDKLELYGLLVLCVGVVNAMIYIGVCLYRYDECQLRKIYWDSSLLREIIGFTGWTVFGQITNAARTHAITLLLNQNYSPAVVAARTLSVQISNSVNMFAASFNTSLYPPIIKNYAAEKQEEMFELIIGGSKITFFLLWVFALPMLIKMESILGFWLTNVPVNTIIFAQLSLIEALILAVSLPLTTAARAPGKMQAYELIMGSIQLVLFFSSWIAVGFGLPAYSVFVIAIIANCVMFFVRLYLLRMLIEFPVFLYIRKAVIPILYMIFFTSFFLFTIGGYSGNGFFEVFCFSCFSVIFITAAMYSIGLDERWRKIIKNKISSKIYFN